ncbi:MAG: hypothetical protein LBS09_02970 [Bacteroidales bacterium]|jgi:hypothetical protein|nr:hypothetical protein [Bacteroidales bacterium]
MNRFFFKITLRDLVQRNIFSVVNIIGLSTGLVVVLLIYLLVCRELSFDWSFVQGDNIYRVNTEWRQVRVGETSARTPAVLANAMRDQISGVKSVVRYDTKYK